MPPGAERVEVEQPGVGAKRFRRACGGARGLERSAVNRTNDEDARCSRPGSVDGCHLSDVPQHWSAVTDGLEHQRPAPDDRGDVAFDYVGHLLPLTRGLGCYEYVRVANQA